MNAENQVGTRPAMPAEYGIAKDAAGMLPWSWVTDRLAGARNYWLCTTRPDGRPHAMPLWALWLRDAVVFSTDASSRKARNLAANPAAVVHLESGDDVVIVEGLVTGWTGDLTDFLDHYEGKYAVRPPPNPDYVYVLRPQVVLAWREHDFPSSATRWAFD